MKIMLSTKQILTKCIKADDAYYNPCKENKKHSMTDSEYDGLRAKLVDIYKKNGLEPKIKRDIKNYLNQIGAPVRSSKRDTVLPFMIGSLNKVTKDKLQKLNAILKMVSKPDFVLGPKLNGTSITLKYKYVLGIHELVDAYSRGDGKVGQSKLQHIENIKGIPSKISTIESKDTFYIRGEALPIQELFDKKFKNKEINGRVYKEALNACSGWINSDEVENPISKIIIFVPYELLDESGNPLVTPKITNKVRALKVLNTLFSSKYEYTHVTSDENLIDTLEKGLVDRKNLAYDTDGLVFEVNAYSVRNVLSEGHTGKYPKFAIAYKQSAKEDAKENGQKSKVTEISVTVNKSALIFPTINFKPVIIGNSNITKASGKNFKHICENGFEVGSKIVVVKAGGIIPEVYLKDEPKKIKPLKRCLCEAKTTMIGPNLYCSKPHKCKFVKQSNLEATLKRLKLTGLGAKNIQKLFDNGYTDIFELLEAKNKKLLSIEGFGESIISTIKVGIPQKLKSLDEPALMDCSGIFVRPGLSLAEKILREIHNGKIIEGERYELFREKKKDYKEWKAKLKSI